MASARHHLVLPELRKFAHLKSFAHARDSPTLRQPCHAAIHSSGDKGVASGERFGKGLQNSAEPIKAIDTRVENCRSRWRIGLHQALHQ